tara:strand:- start:76 stop:1287 length:1212 start_codon:yes stop_codon:yes gene_type:complete
MSGTSGSGGINFGDSGGSQRGVVEYDHNNDFMRFITAGGERLRISSGGNVGVNCTSGGGKLAIRANSSSYEGLELQTPAGDGSGEFHIGVHESGSTAGRNIVFKRGGADGMDTESMRIDSDGRLLLGTNTARAVGGESNPVLHIEGSGNTSNSWVNITRFQSTTAGPNLQFAKARSNTPGTYTLVQSGDTLGTISFLGADGTDMANYAATIKAEVDGTAASNDMPGRLVFSTTADGGTTSTARLTIHNNGQTTKPYQYFLLARVSSDISNYNTGAVPGSAIVYNNIIIEQKDSSMGSRFNTSTGLFTAPYTGIYQFVAAAYGTNFNASYDGFTQSWFLVNGARAYSTDWVVPRTPIIQNSQIIKLSAGDTFGFHPHAGGGGNNTSMTIKSNNYHTYFKAYFLG